MKLEIYNRTKELAPHIAKFLNEAERRGYITLNEKLNSIKSLDNPADYKIIDWFARKIDEISEK